MMKKLCLIFFICVCILFSISGASKEDDFLLSYVRKVSSTSEKISFLEKTKMDIINKKISQKFYLPLCDKDMCFGGSQLLSKYNNKEYVYIDFLYNNVYYILCGVLNNDRSIEIKDMMIINEIQKGQKLIIGDCYKNEIPDDRIIAIVKNENVEIYNNVYMSFSFDISREKFIKIAKTAISCENIGYGE